nr:hypothetical protein [Tanacetum cinerariifolium]
MEKEDEEIIKGINETPAQKAAKRRKLSDVSRLQALVDKKRIVITKEVVHEILQLNDAEGVICLPNEDIFAGLARMGYEKPSTKLTFYKAFFSTQWKFFIHTILHSLSAKRTSWNEFSSAMASAVICLSSGQRFNFSNYIFESLVRNVDSSSKFYMYPRFIQLIIQTNISDLSKHTTRFISPALTQKKVFANMRRVGKGFSRVETPLFENMLAVRAVDVEEEVQVLAQDDVVQEHVIEEIVTEVVPPTPTSPSPSSPDAKVERRQADTQAEIYNIDLDHSSKVLSMQEDTEVQEAVEVVNTAKLITKVVTVAATQVAIASTLIPAAKPKVLKIAAAPAISIRRRKGVVIRDPEEELSSDTPAETSKVKDKGKGILIEDPKPIKKKDQIEMDAKYARKLQEEINKEHEEAYKNINWNATLDHEAQEADDLRKRLEIVQDEDDDVFVEATPLAQKDAIWRNQKSVHGLALVKRWKLLTSCSFHVITLSTVQLFLLVERRYPLSRFTLEQLVNVARLQVEEESEMSLELLRAASDAGPPRSCETGFFPLPTVFHTADVAWLGADCSELLMVSIFAERSCIRSHGWRQFVSTKYVMVKKTDLDGYWANPTMRSCTKSSNEMIPFTMKGNPLVLSWGRTPRLDSDVRVSKHVCQRMSEYICVECVGRSETLIGQGSAYNRDFRTWACPADFRCIVEASSESLLSVLMPSDRSQLV